MSYSHKRSDRRVSFHAPYLLSILWFGILWTSMTFAASLNASAQESQERAKQTSSPYRLASDTSDTPDATNRERLEKKITSLIEQLGSDSYSQRMEAQSELERIGVFALDQLHQASFHFDPQIASIARFMVQSNQFNWAWATDPFNVRRILNNYSTAALYDKSAYIDQLGHLENDEGLGALCRIVRYETQGCLAKKAALLVMRSKPIDEQTPVDRKKAIEGLVEGARSTASTWVVTYTSEIVPEKTSAWKSIIEAESKLLSLRSPETSQEVNIDLKQWVAEQLSKDPASRNEALRIAQTIASVSTATGFNRQMKAVEFAQWALENSFPEIVQEQHDSLDDQLVMDSRFGYLLAESYHLQSNDSKAEEIAELTSKRIHLNSQGQLRQKVNAPNNAPNNDALQKSLERLLAQRDATQVFERAAIGQYLEKRGQFRWAEMEYRMGLDGNLTEFSTQVLLNYLSRMLHEMERDSDAIEVLEPFKKRFDNEPMFRNQVLSEMGGTESLISNYYLYEGDLASKNKDHDLARSSYLSAFELQNDNVDALIGLYRIPNDDSQIAERHAMYQQTLSRMRAEITSREQQLKHATPRTQATERSRLANELNTLAWLVSNTEGDFEEALFLSRKACGIAPNQAAYVDTLARCYATVGRYREALHQQQKAISLDPHSLTMNRTLIEYKSKVEK